MRKKDPDQIEQALNSIERKIPPSKLTDEDKEKIEEAQHIKENIEIQKRIRNLNST